MGVNSVKSVSDLIDPGVNGSNNIQFSNYQRAWQVLEMPGAIFQINMVCIKVGIFSTVTSALVGYGFATFNFPGKNTIRINACSIYLTTTSFNGINL